MIPLVILVLAAHDNFLFLLGAPSLLLLLCTACAAGSAVLINVHSGVVIVIISFIRLLMRNIKCKDWNNITLSSFFTLPVQFFLWHWWTRTGEQYCPQRWENHPRCTAEYSCTSKRNPKYVWDLIFKCVEHGNASRQCQSSQQTNKITLYCWLQMNLIAYLLAKFNDTTFGARRQRVQNWNLIVSFYPIIY